MPKSLYREKQNNIAQLVCSVGAAMLVALSFLLLVCNAFGIAFGAGSDAASGKGTGIVSGFISCWNRVGETLGKSDYIILPKLSGGGSNSLFLVLIFLLLSILAYLAIRSRFGTTMLVFAVPQLLIVLFTSLDVSSLLWVFSAIAIINGIIVMKGEGRIVNSLISLSLISLLSFSLVVGFLDSGILGRSLLSNQRTGLSDSITSSYYGTDPLGHGDTNIKTRSTSEETALTVKMSKPTSMYLKGFTGSLYDGKSWKDLGNITYYNWKSVSDSLEQEGFNGAEQLAHAAIFAGGTLNEGELVQVEVRNVSADSRYAFVPYDISDRGSLRDAIVKGGSLFYGGKLGRFKEYSFTTYGNQVEMWTDIAGGFFEKALGTNDEEIQNYLVKESHYNSFVYENYTYIAAKERKLLGEFIGSPGDQSKGHLDYKKAIYAIRDYLENNFVYSENLYGSSYSSEVGKGENGEATGFKGVDEFLNSGIGYDVQYATLATLMFRYYGIPARYVEGYLVTNQDESEMSLGDDGMYTVNVPRSNAHAWTEIYIDGIGFVPLEVCPEYYGVMSEADMTVGISNEALVRDFMEEYGGKKSENKSEEMEKTEGNDASRYLAWFAAFVAAIPLLLVLIMILKKLYVVILNEKARRKLFYKDSPKRAVSGIYGYMEREGYLLDKEVIALGNKAAYSREEISEEERRFMLSKYQEARKNKNAGNVGKSKSVLVSLVLVLLVSTSLALTGCGQKDKKDNKEGINTESIDALTEVASEVGKNLMEKVPNPGEEGSDTDWIVFALKKSLCDVSDDYYAAYYNNVRARVKRGKGILSENKYTEYERTVIALSAIGEDPKNVEGYDLTGYMDDFDKVTEQGINAVWYALIASEVSNCEFENLERYKDLILESLESGKYDAPDTTDYISIGIQALSFYSESNEEVGALIENSINRLAEYQREDGSMGNAEATAMAIIALTMNDIDPRVDDRFIKNEQSLVDGLMVYYLGEGEFSHVLEIKEGDLLAGQQALMALDSLIMQSEGKKLYE